MQFIHYKDLPPINLDRVATLAKENQQITKDAALFAIGFYEFERRLGYWVFQSHEERDQVFEYIKSQYSKDIQAKISSAASKPTFVKG
ncbi:MAG: hypothetical protein BGO14_00745 [Chlamydiales bacterium 38-26]|nr:hypothetical protein [Chlamydiales bacterium]OJV07250.1 MAG: hypothetical protein BGO14_00745 [Chlamydiales bacterium 38-26]